MPYEDVPIAHVLNYYLYDAFNQSGENDLKAWLGEEGKSLRELAPSSFTDARQQEALDYISALGLDDLEAWMNLDSHMPGLQLTMRTHGDLVVKAVAGDGVPFISSPYFERDYLAYHADER